MKKIRRIMAMLLCICITFAGGGYTSLAAEYESTYETTAEAADTATDSDAVSEESLDVYSDGYEQGLLNYIYIDNPEITTPDTEKVLVGLGDGTADIESAILGYTNNTNGNPYEAEAEYLDNEAALFSMDFLDAGYTGSYSLTSITYVVGGVSYKVDIAESGIDASFGVDCGVETNPDDIVSEDTEDSELDGVVITDGNGEVISSDDFETAIFDAADGRARTGSNGNVVVVLDAGHGNQGDTGAVYTWNGVTYVERDINLKIAQYCKAALEKYTGVTVYMTRTDVNNGKQLAPEKGESVGELVKYAQSVNADILVSIHNNSASASAHGSEVYYPNANYHPEFSQQGKELSELVLAKLQALGLASRGAKIRNQAATDNYPYYPDGSVADYYGIIRQSKLCGFPGIIIEHAFVTNQSDATNFLGSDEALKRLGESDALAIAEYFGLTDTADKYKDGDATVGAVKMGSDNTYTLFAAGVPDAAGLMFKVCSEETGITKEYGAIPGNGDGRWYSSFNVDDFDSAGNYTITAWVKRSSVSSYKVGTTTITVDIPRPVVGAFDADGQKTFILTADNLISSSNVTGVRFGVWNEGLSDLHWYTAQKDANGRWFALMPVADYKKAGTYYTDAYATYNDGKQIKVGSTTYNVTNPTTSGIVVNNENPNNGTFDIVISGVKAASGVAGVRVPVWSASDLSDLHYYNAEKQSDGTYVVHADIKYHKYNYGVYAMQAYVTGNNGVERLTFSYCYNIQAPVADLYAFNADNEANYILVAENIPGGSSVTSVRYGVWNEGLSDLRWYEASKDSLGRWLSIVGIQDYKKSGTYYTDAYATTSDGRTYKVGSTSFTVTALSANMSITNINEDGGTFDVVVSNVESPSGVSSIRIPAWTASDLSDIHWYTAERQTDGTYKTTVNVANHKGHYGVYAVQAYIDAANGISVVAASTCFRFVSEKALYEIAGTTGTTANQMAAYYKANATYPSFYANSDAPTIEAFCQLYIEECAAEGIKAEVAFCQAMKETGFLRYGGAVKIEQYNFAGIGATDNGGTPATFGSVREGIRAQVQHLKAYATTGNLANPCVDPRFSLVTRGTAPYVEWLGIKENPYGKGWASAAGYGYSLRQDYMDKLFKY